MRSALRVVVVAATIAACSALQLSSTSQEVVVITVGNMGDFGNVQVGSSAMTTITIAPATGNQMDTVQAISEMCTDFSVFFTPLPATVSQTCPLGSGSGSGSGIGCAGGPAGGTGCMSISYTFMATFSPTGIGGLESCNVLVNISGSNQMIYLHGNGVPPPHTIDVTPQPDAPIGDVRVNTTSQPATINVTNTGALDLSISSVTLNDPAGAFVVSPSPGPHTLTAGMFESYAVTCHPTQTIGYSATLTINSDAVNQPSAPVTITCTGTDSALVHSPNPAQFPAMRVGDPAATLHLTITNTGGAPSTIDSCSLAAGASPDLSISACPTPTAIGSGGGSTNGISLDYLPSAPHAGPLGTLVINYDSGSHYNVPISGTAATTSMAASVSAVDFGPLCIGETATQHVTAYANNAGPFTVTSITTPGMPFARTAVTLPYSVSGNHGNELAFDVTAMPMAAMDYVDHVLVHTDIPGAQPDLDVALTAKALPDGIAATPDKLDFGLIVTATTPTSTGRTVDFTNCSAAPIAVQKAEIAGLDSREFSIVVPTDPVKTLQPRDSEQFLLVMSPRSGGAKDASLVITYDGGTRTVNLVGTADAGSDGSTTNRETYYACSTGRPTAMWPIGLALLALRRRRRRA